MKAEMFKESGTNKGSSIRVIFFIGMLWSMLIPTILTFSLDWDVGGFIAAFTATSGVFVGLKLGQKPMEEKSKK